MCRLILMYSSSAHERVLRFRQWESCDSLWSVGVDRLAHHSWSTSASTRPSIRRARPNALRVIAAFRHCSAGCRYAPRPSCVRDSSTDSSQELPAGTATTRTKAILAARSRQPIHVRITAAKSSRYYLMNSNRHSAQVRNQFANRGGCQCATRSTWRQGEHFALLCRWRATTESLER